MAKWFSTFSEQLTQTLQNFSLKKPHKNTTFIKIKKNQLHYNETTPDNPHTKKIITLLLSREPPPGYIEEWTELIKQEHKEFLEEKLESLLVFRSKNQWLALPVKVIKDIFPIRPVHSIPHKINKILKGTVNVNGQLKLFISLNNLLEITTTEDETDDSLYSGLMCLINLENDDWVIKIDEIFGIKRVTLSSLENTPVTVSKSTANFFKGILHLDGKDIGYIEEELLFYSLKRRVCD